MCQGLLGYAACSLDLLDYVMNDYIKDIPCNLVLHESAVVKDKDNGVDRDSKPEPELGIDDFPDDILNPIKKFMNKWNEGEQRNFYLMDDIQKQTELRRLMKKYRM